ncbi:hypothetical protein ASPZODRAFT_56228 [Penicilliopsis zonata CBS 506.65]|uniref:RING-type domain-containing protein n=1 Tax=Penicilliopsis zonata CBS 506.65 TaxID=1073090 RepID=A0A1L9SWV8_9EURO|nr:hypothetical protein ASPZODRAFT_56228 [Penicilliopsis zonata CBS 506.65]OJJ51692.1 hypothetical protein ASPZODRAFT_56228 [Penicilliopsis zonata CBS 506.65]
MVVVLALGLGIVSVIIICLLLTIILNRGIGRQPIPTQKTHIERLRKLDAVSPTRTLEQWWINVKKPVPQGDDDSQFVCVVCLEPVLQCQEIRDLKCLHVFHKECLERWYLGDHFNCPLCHRAYFTQDSQPRNEFVWMV